MRPPDELVLEVATGIRPRARAGRARASSARARATREIINVPDCYADPRFDPAVDRASGLPHALHADPAAGRPQRRAGRRHAGAEQGAAACSTTHDEALATRARRAMRGRAAARAHDRGADRRREDAPGARDGARRADEHAAARDAGVAGLRRVRHVPAGRAHRRRHLRPRARRARAARRARRRHRPRHRAGAVGDADARDAAHGVPPRRRPRDRVHCRSTTGSPRRCRRPLHHRVHRPARPARRTGCASISGGQGPILHFHAAAAALHRATSRRAFRSARCRCRAAAPAVDARACGRATSSCCSPTASTSSERARASSSASSASSASCARTIAHADGRAVRRAARRRSQAFAGGAPQEDDMTVVLVKREAARDASARRSRGASTSLPAIVAFTDGRLRPRWESTAAARRSSISRWRSCSRTWSNTAAAGRRRARSTIAAIEGGVEVTLTDYDVATVRRHAARRRSTSALPIEQRAARRAGAAPDPAAGGLATSTSIRTKRRESRIDVPQNSCDGRRLMRRAATRDERC